MLVLASSPSVVRSKISKQEIETTLGTLVPLKVDSLIASQATRGANNLASISPEVI
jgi:hypothetical protein